MLQGRRDFVFDNTQAIQAFTRLKGPKLLYLGDHGHAPSTFPAADTDYAMTLSRRWFDRFLRSEANGVDTGAKVQLAPDPWKGKAVSFAGLPPTRTLTYPLAGRRADARLGGPPHARRRAHEGEARGLRRADVTVAATTTGGWNHLVAELVAKTATGEDDRRQRRRRPDLGWEAHLHDPHALPGHGDPGGLDA